MKWCRATYDLFDRPADPELLEFVDDLIQDIMNPAERYYSLRSLLAAAFQARESRARQQVVSDDHLRLLAAQTRALLEGPK